jgi:hypothetical protein
MVEDDIRVDRLDGVNHVPVALRQQRRLAGRTSMHPPRTRHGLQPADSFFRSGFGVERERECGHDAFEPLHQQVSAFLQPHEILCCLSICACRWQHDHALPRCCGNVDGRESGPSRRTQYPSPASKFPAPRRQDSLARDLPAPNVALRPRFRIAFTCLGFKVKRELQYASREGVAIEQAKAWIRRYARNHNREPAETAEGVIRGLIDPTLEQR